MRTVVVGSVLTGLLVVSVVGVGAATSGVANESPLADAGLDQTVPAGSTVRLDATGSRDPDGQIASYDWAIETPNGTVREPGCPDCGTTSFRPLRTGQYNVTVTVTDDDGATRSDTLYVTVENGTAPSVSLSGPENPPAGSSATYTADLSAGSVPLDRVVWEENGSQMASRPVSGDESATYEFTFSDGTPRNLSVAIVDAAGQRATDSMVVRPEGSAGGSPGRSGNEGAVGGGSMGTDNLEGYNYQGPTVTGDGADPYFDPQADRGEGNYMTVDDVPQSESEAVEHITEDNDVSSTGEDLSEPDDSDSGSGGSGGGYGGGYGGGSSGGFGGGFGSVSGGDSGGETSSTGGGNSGSSYGSGGGGFSVGGISFSF